jgi:acyl-CoA dehydrogenase
MTATAAPPLGTIDFTVPPDLQELLDRIRAFITDDVYPAEREIADPADVLGSWDVVERLRDRARERGIYTPHLPEEWGGLGVGVLGMALINQECGVSGLASLGLNAMAPDEGNMHTLLMAGNAEQLETFLRPLAEGRTRSCFAMTEPDVASSDPTNLETSAVRDGDEWVINGRKWCITGARGAGVLDRRRQDERHRGRGHRNYSLILVPTDTPGWEIEREPEWLGSHSPGGHPIIKLTDVASRSATCSAARARASSSPRSAWPAAAWPTRCAGSASRSARWTSRASGCCSARRSARSSRATRRCSSWSPTRRWTSTPAG